MVDPKTYAVCYERNGWVAVQTPRGTLTQAEAVSKAERKNISDAKRRERFKRKP